MKKTLLFILLLMTVFFFCQPRAVLAAGTGNDVTTHRDGETLYLTTTATNSAQKISTTSAQIKHDLLKDVQITIPTGFATNVGTLFNAILSLVMLLGALLVFLQLILAGFYWITSGGDKGKVDSARQRLIAAIIGLIILASSFAILTLGLNFLGFESLQEVLENTKTLS